MEQTQKIFSILFGMTGSFYSTAAIIVFLHCFYDPGIVWNRKKAILLGITVIMEAVINLFWYDSILAAVPVLLAYLIIPIYDCEGQKLRRFVRVVGAYILIISCAAIIFVIGMLFFLPDFNMESEEVTAAESLLVNVLLTLFFGTVFHYLHRRILPQGIFIPCGWRERLFVTIYSVFNFIMLMIIAVTGREGRATLLIMACTVILFAAMFPIFVYYTRISEYYRERTHYQETYLQAELVHFQQYKQAQEETRRFRHDIRNNLLCMKEMLRSGRTEDAAEYLQSLLDTADTLSAKYVSGDEILDCILSAKVGVMDQKQIRFQLDGVLAGGLPWKPIDVCSVFANALDNAIEACEQLPVQQRMISMKLKATPQFWFVRIQNPVAKNVDVSRLFQKKGGYTTKSNSGQHGIGTFNMKRTVESYGGIVKAECKDQQFLLEFMIDKSSSE